MKFVYLAICDDKASPGIAGKVKGFVKGVNRCGVSAKCRLIAPGRWFGFVRAFVEISSDRSCHYLMVRYAPRYALLFILGGLLCRFHGKKLIIDIPTPLVNHIKEIRLSNERTLIKYLDVLHILGYSFLPFYFSHLCLKYAFESSYFLPSFIAQKLVGNGVDTEVWDNTNSKKAKKASLCGLRVIAVGAIAPWHGWDKLLFAIQDIRGVLPCSVHVDIVGGGPGKSELEKLAVDLGINSLVTFHGFKIGKELTDLYELADVGIGSLAWDRIGVDYASPIKSREYIANGLPVIYKTFDPDLTNAKGIGFKITETNGLETLLVELSKKTYKSKEEITNYSYEFLDYAVKAKAIIELVS